MAENSGSGDWTGTLGLASSLGAIRAVELVGAGADYLSLRWDAASGLLTVSPGAMADYEAFIAAGLVPELSVSLRATLANGQVETSDTVFTIALLDRDDTPPQSLVFVSGGSVAVGEIGAVIGQLQVVDPDTSADSAMIFSLPEEEDWRFEITAEGTLKLRDGITLGLDDLPLKLLPISVSDGSQSAGFLLEITVTDPEAPAPPPLLLAVGQSRGALALPEEERALVLRDSGALLDLAAAAEGERAILVAGEADANLPETVRRIDFLDARLALDSDGPEALALALAGQDATPTAAAQGLAALEAGQALVAIAPVVVAATPEATIRALYDQIAGREPDAAELALQTARLGSGTAAAQIAVDLAATIAAAAGPVWLPWSHGLAAPAADDALPVTALTVEATASLTGFALDLLLA
jgi:hypothetical protein